MYRMWTMSVATLFLLAMSVSSAPVSPSKKGPRGPVPVVKVSLTGTFGGNVTLQAAAQGTTNLVGTGLLQAGNAKYVLKVTSGEVLLGQYVRLQGTISPLGGAAASSFVLVGDKVSGGIKLSYTGGQGGAVTLTTKGVVTIGN